MVRLIIAWKREKSDDTLLCKIDKERKNENGGMKMKKWLVIFLSICMILSVSTAYAAPGHVVPGQAMARGAAGQASYDYMLMVNGHLLNINKTKIYEREGDLMLPLRDLLKGLGFQVRWNGKNGTITTHLANQDFFTIDTKEEDVEILKGTAYIAMDYIRDILEEEDVEVDFDQEDGEEIKVGKKTIRTGDVIVVTGGLDSSWRGGNDTEEGKEASRIGAITDILSENELREAWELSWTQWNDFWAEKDWDDVEGAIEVDEETLFVLDANGTDIFDLEDVEIDSDELEIGWLIRVTYDTTILQDSPRTYFAHQVEQREESMTGRITAQLSESETRGALGLDEDDWNELLFDLELDSWIGTVVLDEETLFLIDEDESELFDEEGDAIAYDVLDVDQWVRISFRQKALSDDPLGYVASKVDLLEETTTGFVTELLDEEETISVLGLDEEGFAEFLEELGLDAWLGTLELDDETLFLIDEDQTDLLDEESETIDFEALQLNQYVQISHKSHPVQDLPRTFVAEEVMLMEVTVQGEILNVQQSAGEVISVLLDIAGEDILFLVDEDTDVEGMLLVGEEVEVIYLNTLLDETPKTYLAKYIEAL